MKVREVFKVYAGKDVELDSTDGIYAFGLKTSNIDECVITTSSSNLVQFNSDIKDKYILHLKDIVISSTYTANKVHVGFASTLQDYPIIICKNLIVLRGSSTEYNPLFVAEYLDKIAIPQYLKDKKTQNERLTKDEIGNLDLPNISKTEQDKLVSIFNPINRRTALYKEIIENNNKIKLSLLEKVNNHETNK